MRGIHRSPLNSPHKGQWRGTLIFSLICARTNGWVKNREVGDLRRHPAHYGVIVMPYKIIGVIYSHPCHNFKGGLAAANSWWTDMINYHYGDVMMGTMTSQITSLTIVYSAIYSGADQRKHESSASLAFVRGIHRGPVNSPHKWPVTGKMFPFDDVIRIYLPTPDNPLSTSPPPSERHPDTEIHLFKATVRGLFKHILIVRPVLFMVNAWAQNAKHFKHWHVNYLEHMYLRCRL